MRSPLAWITVSAGSLLITAIGCGSSSPCTTVDCGGALSTVTASTSGGGGSGGSGGGAPATFPCKGLTCKIGSEACTVTSHNSQNDMGACTSLPLPCLADGADCTCFAALDAECQCQAQPTGGFAIFCAYPD